MHEPIRGRNENDVIGQRFGPCARRFDPLNRQLEQVRLGVGQRHVFNRNPGQANLSGKRYSFFHHMGRVAKAVLEITGYGQGRSRHDILCMGQGLIPRKVSQIRPP